MLAKYFSGGREECEKHAYRLGTRRYKKVRDEVAPVVGLFHELGLPGTLHFPLDSHVPDAWYSPVSSQEIGIEVTRALGRSDYETAKELNETGLGRGFVGLQDNAPAEDFASVMEKPRVAYSTTEAVSTMQEGISTWVIQVAMLSTQNPSTSY